MTEPEGTDELRARLRRVEEDAAAARVLARGADQDVGDLRSGFREFRTEMRAFRDQNNRVLSVMREDLTDLRAHVDDGFMRIDAEFALVQRNFLAVHSKIDGVAAGLRVITDLLTRRNDDQPPDRT